MDIRESTRTVKPDGEAIKQRRLKKGWRVEDLAKRAKCSVKTVENVERGENVLVFTLKKFAEAFEADFPSLLQGAAPPPARASRASEKRVEVQIKLSIPYDEFDESDQLVGFVQALLRVIGAKNEVKVLSVEDGSVVIKLEMSEEDARRLSRAHEEGKLRDLSVYYVHFSFGPSWKGWDTAPDAIDEIIHAATATIWRATIGFVLLFLALIGMGTMLIAAISQAVATGAWGREMMAIGATIFGLTAAILTITYLLVIRTAVRIQRAAREEKDRRGTRAAERIPAVRQRDET